jgi:hypothetical protein
MSDQIDRIFPSSFYDYSLLDTATAASLQFKATTARGLLKRTSEDILAIGRLLLEAKAQLPHGQYLPWVKAELGISQSTAWRFTQAALGKPIKVFKANDLLALKEPEKEQERQPSAEDIIAIKETLGPFLQDLREQRAEFRQLEEQRLHRLTWLQEQRLEPEEDDILALLEEEIFAFAGIRQEDFQQARELADQLRAEPGPFTLEEEKERVTWLVDQMRTARSGLFGISIEIGQRLSRIRAFFVEEEHYQALLSVKEEALKRHHKKFVQEALQIGYNLLEMDRVLPAGQIYALARDEFRLQPDQVQLFCDAARRSPAGLDEPDLPADLAYRLAALYYDIGLAQQAH